ncbi:kinase-like domain-containing protein [Spinellus fusiger]|nr:kinase-like domain-containing protein [Spinellus fusiger]
MLLRVYGIGCDQIVDRPNELFWLSRLSTLHMGPALLGIFGNGRFEEYLDSTTLTHCAIRDPTTSQQIGGCLRRMHDIVHVYPPMAGEDTEVWRNIKKWHAKVVDLLPEMSRKDSRWDLVLKRVKLGKLSMEIDACREILNQLQSPIVFSHNDTQYGNILRLENTGALVLVDFEYAGYNPRGYDIANHFCEWMYNYHSKHPDAMEPSQFPVYEERVRFCKAYLEAGRDMNTTPEALEKEVSSWLMGSHLFWGLWGLIQASQSDIDFDYFSYSMQRLDSFQEELERCLIK